MKKSSIFYNIYCLLLICFDGPKNAQLVYGSGRIRNGLAKNSTHSTGWSAEIDLSLF
jgi:hypothetical protein